jgi:hypothetical protein
MSKCVFNLRIRYFNSSPGLTTHYHWVRPQTTGEVGMEMLTSSCVKEMNSCMCKPRHITGFHRKSLFVYLFVHLEYFVTLYIALKLAGF